MMKIIVLVKQVPDTTEVRIDPKTNTLVREGVASIMNPYDQFALEEAVRLKEKVPGSSITVMSMGPPQARKVLLKALALGADEAVLLSDRAFAGSDTWATSVALSHAIRKIGDYDAVLCGLQAIDGDTAQVGPETAQLLDIPQVTYVEKVDYVNGEFTCIQQTEDGSRKAAVKPPFLVTCIPPPSFLPRIAPFPGLVRASSHPYRILNADDIGADRTEIGLNGSPTQVSRTYSPPPRGEVRMLSGDPKSLARELAEILQDNNLLEGAD
jgi:electron transfer flavoprotein beta subunit